MEVRSTDIAIVAMDGRFPGANTVEALWQNLCEGIPGLQRFADDSDFDATKTHQVHRFGFVDSPEWFDPHFFSISTIEALLLNPQHRLFIECCHHALDEAAAFKPGNSQRIGVIAAASQNDYIERLRQHFETTGEVAPNQLSLYNQTDFLATFAAYLFDLRGTVLSVQTACSSSLVAIHMACQSLINFESDIMLAGAACISNLGRHGYTYQPGGIYSNDGHCRPFDDSASGTVGGNGVGVVALKRLEDALADKNIIHAVIRGSAINNDGRIKANFFAPSVNGQRDVIEDALAFAGLNASAIGYIETHGTGTRIGDPIEFAALREVFENSTEQGQRCYLGSIKSAIGHTDSAAGVIGLIKVALAVREATIPMQMDYTQPNSEIDLAASPFAISTANLPWCEGQRPRIAGVTALGIGGTNAHVIVAQSPPQVPSTPPRPINILPISAHNTTCLTTRLEQMMQLVKTTPSNLSDIAFSLGTARQRHRHRAALVVTQDTQSQIQNYYSHLEARQTKEGKRDIVFLFPGQGTPYYGMARKWHQSESVFREYFELCRMHLQNLGRGSVITALLAPAPIAGENNDANIAETNEAQPALFVFQYCLAQTLMTWGVRADYMAGHSLGEIVASCISGVLTLADSLKLVLLRAGFMAKQAVGAMVALSSDQETAQALAQRFNLEIAAINGPHACVLAGNCEQVHELEQTLQSTTIQYKRLATSHAFHSALMMPAVAPFQQAIADLPFTAATIPFTSNVNGELVEAGHILGAQYWAQHIRQPVRFSAGLNKIMQRANNPVFIELGPGRTLLNMAKTHGNAGVMQDFISILPNFKRDDFCAALDLAHALAEMWACNIALDWDKYFEHETRQLVSLPTYPYQRIKFWPATATFAAANVATPVKPSLAEITPIATSQHITQVVLEVAAKLLGGEPAADDNFFALGGNSLLAVNFAANLARRLQCECGAADIMASNTLGAIKLRWATPNGPTTTDITPAQHNTPLSPSQQWMWLWQKRAQATPIFNVPYLIKFVSAASAQELASRITRCLHRFDALRLRFNSAETGVWQHVDPSPLPILLQELTEITDFENEICQRTEKNLLQPFDLGQELPTRVTLFYAKNEFGLSLIFHHIAIDGWSLSIVMNAVIQAIEKDDISAVAPSYLDLAKQEIVKTSPKSAEYWSNYLAALPPNIENPGDLPRPKEFSFKGGEVNLTFTPEQSQAIKAFASKEKLSLYHLFLAAYAIQIGRQCGAAQDVWIRSPIANRKSSSMDVVGLCLGTIVIRLKRTTQASFLQIARQVAQATIAAIEHNDVAPMHIIDAAGPVASDAHFSRFPFEFNHLEYAIEQDRIADQNLRGLAVESPKQTKADLSLTSFANGNTLVFSLSYYTEVFSRISAERFLSDCMEIILQAERILASECP